MERGVPANVAGLGARLGEMRQLESPEQIAAWRPHRGRI